MESSTNAQSVLGEMGHSPLQCFICNNHFQQPKVLDCLHNFCLKCLEELKQRQGPPFTKLQCPLCRHETPVKEVATLPQYFTLSALVEEAQIMEQLLATGRGSEVICQACEESNAAVSRCMDCGHFLCGECVRAHARLMMIKSHVIYPLAQLRSGKVVFKSRLREHVPKCGTHPDQSLTLYCNTCQQLVCTICSTLDHNDSSHSITDVNGDFDKCKQDVAEQTDATETIKTKLSKAASETDECLDKLTNNFVETNNKISKRAEEDVAKIRAKEWKLKQELENIYEDRLKTFETIQTTNSQEEAKVEHKLDQVNRLMTQASCYEILDLRQKLLQNLKELEMTCRQPLKISKRSYFMDFEEGERSLRRQVLGDEHISETRDKVEKSLTPRGSDLKETWKLKTNVKKFGSEETRFKCAYDVAVFSDHETVVADIKLQQLVKSSPDKFPTFSEVQPFPNLTDPSHVSVNKDDQLIVLDGPTVKTFNRDYKLLHHFMPDGEASSKATCLAVDEDNQIAVGYQYKEEVSLHNPDGSVITTLPAPMISEHLTIHEHCLIYTNHKNRSLRSMNYNKDVIFSVDITSDIDGDWGPTGLCCDCDGSIYVAVNGWSRSEIQCISPEGKFLGCILEGCGFPWGLAMIPDCEYLVVAAHNCIAIFNRLPSSSVPQK